MVTNVQMATGGGPYVWALMALVMEVQRRQTTLTTKLVRTV